MTAPPEPMRKMDSGFADALGGHPALVQEAVYAFAGRSVRLRVVGSGFGQRTHRAFSHLLAQGNGNGQPILRIDLWDETETAIPCPIDAGSIDFDRQWVAAGGTLAASPDGRYVSFRFQDSIAVLDRHRQRILGCRRNGSGLSGGEYSKPLVLLLSVWYHDRSMQVLHAGLIARGGVGVLLPGESGTGKSTTCVASISQGLEYLGDDFVGLEHSADGGFLGHSLFSTACLARKDLSRFRGIGQRAVEDGAPGEEKPILFLSEIYPDRLLATVPIRAVVLLRVGCERTEIHPARRPEALRGFAASTLHTVVPRPGREALRMIGALVEQVPAWWLLLGPELNDLAPSINQILTQAAGRDAP